MGLGGGGQCFGETFQRVEIKRDAEKLKGEDRVPDPARFAIRREIGAQGVEPLGADVGVSELLGVVEVG